MQEISWLPTDLLASEEGLCSMQSVMSLGDYDRYTNNSTQYISQPFVFCSRSVVQRGKSLESYIYVCNTVLAECLLQSLHLHTHTQMLNRVLWLRNGKFHKKLLNCFSFHLYWTTTTWHYELHIFVHVHTSSLHMLWTYIQFLPHTLQCWC